ncbi:LPS export ABC transporter permease LptF [uncultured Tateyamaria sp.]|uniref:LPS export ABC transporter permease LptF n=1 Tax=Tateyamaria sp. 1078 TaxID=3417464 RepID=UPI002615BFFB|nr:LPS export ABC transporter permease LptF [uncultured Tateyamaria sp.]
MARFDRYLLSQLLVLFGFFSLVLVAVFWINRAVQLFDRLIGDGQTALVFLEFTVLGLPRLVTTVLPIATFAATIYVTNRLNNESELTVMASTGSSPWRLARPVFLFGLISAVMMTVLSHDLVPRASAQLSEREVEISQNITARILTEGTFLSPVRGVTFYTREIGEDGVLRDVFVADRRDPSTRMIYTAAEAYLVRNDTGTSLIMVDGLAQRLLPDGLRLSTAKFQDFSFDISGLMRSDATVAERISNMSTWRLLQDRDALLAEGTSAGALAEETHSRFARATFCVVTALIGFATLLVGGYSRFGVWREIVIAFLLLLALDGTRSTLTDPVLDDASKWWILYAPSVVGAVIVTGMLWSASHPGWVRRRLRGVA